MTEAFRRFCLVGLLVTAGIATSRGQSVDDPIDDPLDCATGKAAAGLLPAVVDIISVEIRKQNDDLVATLEFRGDPSIGDSVSGGILVSDPNGFSPAGGSGWHFQNAGNAIFGYAGDAVSTGTAKSVVDSLGAWAADTTTSFTATRAGNVVIVRIPGDELGPASVWMAFSTSELFEVTARCDAAGNNKNGFPILEVPTLVASEDHYDAAGNVRITIPGDEGVLINDIDAVAIVDNDEVSANGGSVVMDESGGFQFDPPPGFAGDDAFSYTVTDGKGGVSTANVTVKVGPALWFVDATAGAGSATGRWSGPFPDIASFRAATEGPSGPKPKDAILIFGDHVYESGLVLDSGQVVVGQGVDMLAVLQAVGYQLPLHSEILDDPPAITPPPTLVSDSLNAIEVAQNNRIFGIAIGDTPRGAAIHGDSVASLHVSEVTIGGRGAILDLAKGTIDVSLGSASSDSAAGDGISLKSIDGLLNASGSIVITAPGRDGLRIRGGAAGVDFGELEVSGADSGAAVTIGDALTGRLHVGDVRINSDSGGGIEIDKEGELRIDSGTIRTGGTALDLQKVFLDVRLDSISSSGLHGVRLAFATGSLVLSGKATIDSTASNGLDVLGSSLRLAFAELAIGRADTAFAIMLQNSAGSILRVQRLRIDNAVGGGMVIQDLDSVIVEEGSVLARGRRAIELRDAVARVRLDSLRADSADAGIVLYNVGGSFEIGGNRTGGAGRIDGIAGRAVDAWNITSLKLSGLDVANISADAVRIEHFGEVDLSEVEIADVDSAGVWASAGGTLEVRGISVANARTGIEAYQVDNVLLEGNSVTNTDSTAVIVTNANPLTDLSKRAATFAGSLHARVLENEVATDASEGILVSAVGSGDVRLELAGNQADSSTDDYALVTRDTASILLEGFAGGDEDAVTAFVRRVNLGFPRVRVQGTISPGPGGQADVAALDMTVSDAEPLPERLVEYRVRITNRGPAPAFGVVMTDSLPEGLAYAPASITVNGNPLTDEADDDGADFGATKPQTITAMLGDLSLADTAVVTFGVRPQQAHAGSSVTNVARVESESPDSIASDNQVEIEITIKLNTRTGGDEIPGAFVLRQNYPNPFNPSTKIGFDVPSRTFVRLTIVNVLGQVVEQLVAAELNPGRYEARWDARAGRGATSGLYFYRLEAGSFTSTRRMMLLK